MSHMGAFTTEVVKAHDGHGALQVSAGRAAPAVLPCPQALPRPIARCAERRSGWVHKFVIAHLKARKSPRAGRFAISARQILLNLLSNTCKFTKEG